MFESSGFFAALSIAILILPLCIGVFYFFYYKHVEKTSSRNTYIEVLGEKIDAIDLKPLYWFNIPIQSTANIQKDIANYFYSNKWAYTIISQAFENQEKEYLFSDILLNEAPSFNWKKNRLYQHLEKQICEKTESRVRPIVPDLTFDFSHIVFHYKFVLDSPYFVSINNLKSLLFQEYTDFLREQEEKANRWQTANQVKYNQARSAAQAERSKVTPGLRYDILRRDGFRCVLCGRSAKDGVELEVDHIIPISKGGRSVPENLRTLCKDCNRGKRDKFE